MAEDPIIMVECTGKCEGCPLRGKELLEITDTGRKYQMKCSLPDSKRKIVQKTDKPVLDEKDTITAAEPYEYGL